MSLNYIREYSMSSTEICDEIIELFEKHNRQGNTRPGEISRGVDKNTKDSLGDDYRFDYDFWNPWQIKYR